MSGNWPLDDVNLKTMERVARAYAEQAGYRFHEKVGSGAFKETFLVSDASGPLALKVLGSNCSTARTEREIEALRRCSHRNIARLRRVIDFVFEGGTHKCLVEDYLSGDTLAKRLVSGLYSRDEFKILSVGLLNALVHLNGLGLVHRDIKPENVMYKSLDSDQPVLVDFGLVRDLSASSLTQTWFPHGPGTPLFAPPEQLTNRKEMIDWRADQFSVGVTLAFALLGFHPYSLEGDVEYECVDRVANWQEPSERFRKAAEQSSLPILVQMVRPYPVQRVRTPSKLLATWEAY